MKGFTRTTPKRLKTKLVPGMPEYSGGNLYPLGLLLLWKGVPMKTSDHYLKFAAECEQLALLKPSLADGLEKIAEAWRALAIEAAQKEQSAQCVGSPHIEPSIPLQG